MAIRLTKTSKIVFAILIFLLSVALGFLIWRVNQQSNLSPTDSDAGGTGEPGDTYCCRIKCCDGTWIAENCNTTGTYKDICKDAKLETDEQKQDACGSHGYGKCDDKEVVKCSCKSWANGCGTDCTFPSGTQAKVDSMANGTCKAYIAMCNVSNGSVYYEEYKPGQACYGKKDECKNPYAKDDCTPQNVCDGGSWVTKPSGNINFEKDITFSAKAKDSDGIKKASIVVKKGSTTLPVCTATLKVGCINLSEAATETTISGTLSNSTSRLEPGTYTVSMSWKDNKDATSAACALTTTFTVLPKQTNPDWSITKAVVEQCIDENTENPKSELTYTITVRNTGDGSGNITKVEDVLDSKVVDSFVQTGTITSPGVYSSGKILWDYTSAPLALAAGASKVYTYKVVVDKDSFGTYANTVTMTPEGSDAVIATANIGADCVISERPPEEIPETGLFDSTASRIVAGFVLVVFGVLIYNVPNNSFVRREDFKYRDKFEKKVANR